MGIHPALIKKALQLCKSRAEVSLEGGITMKNAAVRTHRSDGSVLGLELGSTRIKAAGHRRGLPAHRPPAAIPGKADYTDGVWTYDLAEVWTGLACGAGGAGRTGEDLGHGGIRHDARVSGL